MSELFNAMISVLSAWLVLFLIFTGLGLFIIRSFGRRIQHVEGLLISFWLGWAFVILILQLWHLQFPVDWRIFILISIIGTAGLFWNWKDLWHFARKNFLKKWPFFIFILLIAIWLANRAICLERLYDTGLYHLNSVHWAKAFPIVPGLGNLHGRLAFNNSYFLYAAMLEAGPWALKSQHLAAGILLLILFAQTLISGIKILQRNSGTKSHHLFSIMMFTPILIKAFSSHVSSLSPDLPVFVLGVVFSAKLLALLEAGRHTSRGSEYEVFLIILLAALGITIKLSFFVFGVSGSFLAVIVFFFRKREHNRFNRRKTFVWITTFVVIMLLPWMVRGVILSGHPFYPSTIGSLPVEWRLPRLAAIDEANWIRGWARKPNVHWSEVLGNWDWFRPWAYRMIKTYEVIVPLALLVIACLLVFYCQFRRINKRNAQGIKWLFLLPPIASLIYWFITAPDLRFVGAGFWVLGAGAMTLGVCRILKSKTIMILCITFFILCSWFIYEKIPIGKELFRSQIYPLRYAELERFETRSGLIIYVPKKGDQCWNGPLLCTPFPKADLRLRKEGKISKGFMLD